MENNNIVKVAAYIIVGSVVVPIVIGAGATIVGGAIKLGSHIVYNHKIKKGLKEGSVVEIDGDYYEVKNEVEVND